MKKKGAASTQELMLRKIIAFEGGKVNLIKYV